MGTLVPPWYQPSKTSTGGLLVAAVFLGATAAVAAFDCSKAWRQSYRSWRRNHRVNTYVIMLWAVISTCLASALGSWLFLQGIIRPSIWFFLVMLVLWTIQIQCLMQILANRLSLILYNPDKERRLKVGLLIAIGFINISVFCIWVPARLQISETWIHVNEIWDRIEKAIFAVIDMSLNTYFMWLVKSKLVDSGLTRYNLVYKFNLAMVVVSISLDILVIGIMSLPDDAVYMQAHPLTFLTKLNIEMNMAELLAKVVKRSTETRPSPPTAATEQPRLSVTSVFDRDWIGSVKEVISGSPGERSGSSGGGQMHELNLDMLNTPKQTTDEEGSSSRA